MIAYAERGEVKGQVTLTEIGNKKRKVLHAVDDGEEFKSIQFSSDTKHLLAFTGQSITLWFFERAQVLGSIKLTGLDAKQVMFAGPVHSHFTMIGTNVLRCYRYFDGTLKLISAPRSDVYNYVCHVWASRDRLVCATAEGPLHVYELGEMRFTAHLSGSSDEGGPVRQLVAFSRGVIALASDSRVYILEKDGGDAYKTTKVIKPEVRHHGTTAPMIGETIVHIALNPTEEFFVAISDRSQIYIVYILAIDVSKADGVGVFEHLQMPFHSMAITDVSMCKKKPIVATVSKDQTVRVWNYLTYSLDTMRKYDEEALSVTIHPTGNFLAVGFATAVVFLNILIEDFKEFHRIPVPFCRTVKFSEGGHLLAVVRHKQVEIYSTTTFHHVSTLSTHTSRVTDIMWHASDARITSCGIDGMVFEYKMESWMPEEAWHYGNRTNIFTSLAKYADRCIVNSMSGEIIHLHEGTAYNKFKGEEKSIVSLLGAGHLLFGATFSGKLKLLPDTLSPKLVSQEVPAHRGLISGLALSPDERVLATVGEDHTVMLWRVDDPTKKRHEVKIIDWCEEVLIRKAELEEKNASIATLRSEVNRLRREGEYALRLKDLSYNEKMAEVAGKFVTEVEELDKRGEALTGAHNDQAARYRVEQADLLELHERNAVEEVRMHALKMQRETDKYRTLADKTLAEREEFEIRCQQIAEEQAHQMESKREEYEEKIAVLEMKVAKVQTHINTQSGETEKERQMIELDAEGEMLGIKTKFEKKLRAEQNYGQKLRNEAAEYKQKFSTLTGKIDELMDQVQKCTATEKRLKKRINDQETDIVRLRSEAADRVDGIDTKEERIVDLRRKNQDLEKFKFVLEYKISELRKEVEPRDEEIAKMLSQKREMVVEMNRFEKSRAELLYTRQYLGERVKAGENVLTEQREETVSALGAISRYKGELVQCWAGGTETDEVYVKKVVGLYRKYIQDAEEHSTRFSDSTTHEVWQRLRDHMEKNLRDMRRRFKDDVTFFNRDYKNKSYDNVTLIRQVNEMRMMLKGAREKQAAFTRALYLLRKNKGDWDKTMQVIKEEDQNTYMKAKLAEKDVLIQQQQEEIAKARVQFVMKEAIVPVKRGDGGDRLDPIPP